MVAPESMAPTSKFRLLLLGCIALLPSFLKRPCYRVLFGYQVGRRVRVGLSIIDARDCRLEDDVGSVVEVPVAMQDPALGFHLPEQRRSRIGRQDMKRGAFEPVLLDPVARALEDVGPVVVEAEDEAPVHLDPVVVEDPHATRIVLGARRLLARVGEVLIVEGLEPDENSGTTTQCHLAHE